MAEDKDRKGKSLADYAKMMGVDASDLKEALRRYGMGEDDLVNQQKRGVLADAMEQKWSKDRFQANYDARVAESADFSWEEIVSQFGYSLGVLQEFKDDLRPVFQWLARELQKGESLANLEREFNEKISKTEFGRRPPSELEADLARYDKQKRPEFQKNLKNLADEIRRVARGKYGDSILTELEGPKGRELAMSLVYEDTNFLSGRFDSEKILRAVEPIWRANQRKPAAERAPTSPAGGESGDFQVQLMGWLSRNGVVLEKDRIDSYLDKMLNTNWSLEQVKQDVRNTVFTRQYAAYADLFAQGQDVADIALDFRQSAASLLEKSIDAVGIDDPLVKRAMQHKGADGKPAQMALWEFEREVRKTPEWDKTNNAMSAYTDIGETILRNFGFRG